MQDQDSNEHNRPGLSSKAVVGISILDVIRDSGEIYKPYPLDAPELSIRSEPGPTILRMEIEVVVDQEVVDWLQSVAGEQSDPLALLKIVQIAQGEISKRPSVMEEFDDS